MLANNHTELVLIANAGVNNSYWAHVGDIEKMNCLLREDFVELYNQPILENVSKVCFCELGSALLDDTGLLFMSIFSWKATQKT